MERIAMNKLTGIRENIDALLEIEESGFIEVSHEEHEYIIKKQRQKASMARTNLNEYEKRDNFMGETNVHWLCVDLNKMLKAMHYILPEIAHAMRLNLEDVDKEKRETLEDIIEFTDDLAQYIRREQERNIDKMREFSGLREYGKGMKL
jgi:hypothetical protein